MGLGGPGYKIDCELDGDNQYHDKGVLIYGTCWKKYRWFTILSICHNRQGTQHLDGNHTCFGKVTLKGLDLVGQIQEGDKFNVEIED